MSTHLKDVNSNSSNDPFRNFGSKLSTFCNDPRTEHSMILSITLEASYLPTMMTLQLSFEHKTDVRNVKTPSSSIMGPPELSFEHRTGMRNVNTSSKVRTITLTFPMIFSITLEASFSHLLYVMTLELRFEHKTAMRNVYTSFVTDPQIQKSTHFFCIYLLTMQKYWVKNYFAHTIYLRENKARPYVQFPKPRVEKRHKIGYI